MQSLKAISKDAEEFDIPLDISDLITICKEYNKLGWVLQKQIENILEYGLEECIKTGTVKKESLPFIKEFFITINKNAYFGDAADQASNYMKIISIQDLIPVIKNLN